MEINVINIVSESIPLLRERGENRRAESHRDAVTRLLETRRTITQELTVGVTDSGWQVTVGDTQNYIKFHVPRDQGSAITAEVCGDAYLGGEYETKTK